MTVTARPGLLPRLHLDSSVPETTPREPPVTIPTSRYTDRAFGDLEMARMWQRVWQMACREDEVAAPGDYATYGLGDQSVLVVRGDDGRLRAFHNVCRHRGNRLREGCGHADELRCRYHCWAWTREGTLLDVPDRAGFGALDENAYGLRPVRVDTWGGFVFVALDPAAADLQSFLAPVAAEMDAYRLADHVPVVSLSTTVAANWKVVVEAFLEVYHVMGIHPQLLPMLDDLHTSYDLYDTHTRMVVPFAVPSPRLGPDVAAGEVMSALLRALAGSLPPAADGDGTGPGASPAVTVPAGTDVRAMALQLAKQMAATNGQALDLDDSRYVDDWHYHLFPNLVFNMHAGRFLFFRMLPGADPDHSRFDFQVYELVDDPDERARRRAPLRHRPEGAGGFGEVLDQDLRNLPGVQQGLHSDGLDRVTLSVQECRIARFHEVLLRWVGDADDADQADRSPTPHAAHP